MLSGLDVIMRTGTTRRKVYLDNNSTTIAPAAVVAAAANWAQAGNPSSSHAEAKEAAAMIAHLRAYIMSMCDITDDYSVIFTSGASEANCSAIRVICSPTLQPHIIPHAIVSSVEHKSIMNMIEYLALTKQITVTYVDPTPSGHIMPAHVRAAILPNTRLICVMHVNNETGAINDVESIARIVREHNTTRTSQHKQHIMYHCDTAQSFGKIPAPYDQLTSFCASFHKNSGLPGCGAWIVRTALLGNNFQPTVFGQQNAGARGGTENVPGLAAAWRALTLPIHNVDRYPALMRRLMEGLCAGAAHRGVGSISYSKYLNGGHLAYPNVPVLVFLSDHDNGLYLPTTLLFALVDKNKKICNSDMKKALERAGIIVSIGSACNTSSASASHVLTAMRADEYVRRGVLRLSMGVDTTTRSIDYFVRKYCELFLTK